MAQLTSAAINDLPDSAFAYIEPGGTKDAQGKTVPRSKRHFPIHDKAHVQNALARAPQSPFGPKAMPKILAAAKKFGIAVSKKDDPVTTTLALRGDLVGVRETRNTPLEGFEIREAPDGSGGSRLTFTGYASVTESPYTVTDMLGEYQETISRSAFDKTLAEGADVSFLVNHEGVSMARTRSGSLRLASDSTGLHVEAALNPARPDVQIARAAIQDGDLTEMSFAFRAIRQDWDEDYTTRRLNEVSLHHGDVSVVNYGANPATAGSIDLRSIEAARAVRGVGPDTLVAAFRDLRTGAPLTADSLAVLRNVLRLTSDQADELLSEFQLVEPVTPPVDPTHNLDLFRARAHALRLHT